MRELYEIGFKEMKWCWKLHSCVSGHSSVVSAHKKKMMFRWPCILV